MLNSIRRLRSCIYHEDSAIDMLAFDGPIVSCTWDWGLCRSEEDNYVSYLVDRNGNAYEPYSLAWRYLGMYIDCDVDAQGDNEERFLDRGDDDDCQRTVLWAAVSHLTLCVARFKNQYA
jgi:hypothetical protein